MQIEARYPTDKHRQAAAAIVDFFAQTLYFQSFNRLYDAYREFLQGLFIARRTYPIAYDKWIREQIAEILELPALYQALVALWEIDALEGPALDQRANTLRRLWEEYVR